MNNVLKFPAPKEPIVDPTTVKQLEQALELAKKGELTGLVILAWDPTVGAFIRWVSLPHRESDTSAAAFRFLGGAQLALEDLKYLSTSAYHMMSESK
jgi:hypothetical protein